MSIAHLAEHFAQRAEACASYDDLAALLADAGREIGFEHFAITLCDNLRQTAPRFAHLDNYPAVYAEIFVARGFYRIDPVLIAAQRRVGGFAWTGIADLVPLKRGQAELLERAAREGLLDGYTIPANVPGEPCGAISFASRKATALTSERRWGAEFIGRTAFEATRRMRGLSAAPSPVPHLNAREIQCLRRLRMGEIDKEIARALGISPETVRQYVKRARAGYRARTRAHLMALTLRDGQIGFEDAIPPFG